MSTAISMPCPKCTAPMRTIERNGIHLETCPECRGIFLDRGELDRLIDLEARAVPAADVMPETRGDRGRQRFEGDRNRDWDDDDDDARGMSGRRGPSSRRRGFLGEMFEGFGD